MTGYHHPLPRNTLRDSRAMEVFPAPPRKFYTIQPAGGRIDKERYSYHEPRFIDSDVLEHSQRHDGNMNRRFQNRGCALALSITNIFLAIIILILGCVCTGLGWTWYVECEHDAATFKCKTLSASPSSTRFIPNCAAASPLWQGILTAFTSAVGIAAIMGSRRTLLIAFQILSIVCCIFLTLLLGVMATYMGLFSHFIANAPTGTPAGPSFWNTYYEDPSSNQSFSKINIVLDALIFVAALIYILLSISSSAILCYNWDGCCPRKSWKKHPQTRHYDNFAYAPRYPYMVPQSHYQSSSSRPMRIEDIDQMRQSF